MAKTRPPRPGLETLLANSRPQPAIPAVLVLLITGMLGNAAVAGGSGSLAAIGLTVGLLASCGLAIAAGFCSYFPTLAWVALAMLFFGRAMESLALHSRLALGAGIVAALVMTGYQVWRVRTGRFVPTITERDPAAPDES